VVNVARRIFITVSALLILLIQARAETIKWVNFDVPYESLQYAMEADIDSFEKGNHISWIDILAVSACRTGGKCGLQSVKRSLTELRNGKAPEEILGGLYKYFDYYQKAYKAVLGGLLGIYSVVINGQERVTYGLKAFSPIAAGYGYSHCADFGNERSFGFTRKHLGNDIMGSLGTPIVAVEGGVVEVMGWNRYGGWRIGVRSFDSKRYYYYAHLQKDTPFAPGLEEGDIVQAGELLGFMGRTGYSDKENVNNISKVHLHFGLQLVFDESQKECNSEIWVDVYDIVKLLQTHRCSYRKTESGWKRIYPYEDLDIKQ
jgi:murein DD-endopeptidase MepM/ murein hydrolase activator NlpD